MSTSKHIDKICIAAIALALVITVLFMFGEKLGITAIHREEDEQTSNIFTANDLNADWDTTGACKITLNGENAEITGNGAYFAEDTLHIVYAGKYILSGTLNGSVQIDADGDDKIWLLLSGVDITSETEPPICIEQADKVFITLKEGTQNNLTFENSDESAENDGCIFSRDDLTVNGKGGLTVKSSGLHGIVCNDSIVFTGGNINITAKKDGVHAHDAVKICSTDFTVAVGDDGLHAGNDDESAVFYMESGNVKITECYEGIEANDVTIAGGTVYIEPSDDGINANGRGNTSVITISGGDITIINKNGRDADGLDSNGDIVISGGKVLISVPQSGSCAIDFGSESGGECRINGGTVVACGGSSMLEAISSDSKQAFIMQTVSGAAGAALTLADSSGKVLINETVPVAFSAVTLSTPEMKNNDVCTLTVGENSQQVTVGSAVSGGTMGRGDFNRGDFGGKGKNRDSKSQSGNTSVPEMPSGNFEPGQNNEPPDMPSGQSGTPPQKPDGNFPGGDMPSGQNGNPPEIPGGDNMGDIGNPGGGFGSRTKNFGDMGDNQNKTDRRGEMRPEDKGQSDFENKTTDKNAPSKSTWLLILISALVLSAGIFAAVKKNNYQP